MRENLQEIIETAQRLLRQAEILFKQSQEIIKVSTRLVEQMKREDQTRHEKMTLYWKYCIDDLRLVFQRR